MVEEIFGIQYLIGQKFGGHNFRRTKIFGGQNFRHQIEISAVLSAELFSQNNRLLTRNLSLQRDFTMCYNFSDIFHKNNQGFNQKITRILIFKNSLLKLLRKMT